MNLLQNAQKDQIVDIIWKEALHRLEWINSLERGRENAQDARVFQTVRRETIYGHICYHIRNILRSAYAETQSICNAGHP